MKATDITDIPKEKFVLVQHDQVMHDEKLKTKPIGYLKDAIMRFSRNKGSVVAAYIIAALMLFAILVSFFSTYSTTFKDGYYSYAVPKSTILSKYGIMTGISEYTYNQQSFDYYNSMPGAIVEVLDSYEVEDSGRTNTYYDVRVDSYKKVGYVYKNVTPEEYDAILQYQEETGRQILYPMIDTKKIKVESYKTDANYWYEHNMKGAAEYDKNGEYQDIFLKDDTTEDGYAYYTAKMGGAQYQVRVLYYEYFRYVNGKEPCFLFGADGYGQDILVRLASGARLSFLLGISVATINFILGTIYGAIEGYYGGTLDLTMERIIDILAGIPFLIVVTLFQMYLVRKVGPVVSLLFAFISTGWIGTAGRVRAQFYRYKGQEYVLAARTLGAKDRRLIFRHILPNALGTIITGSVLMIPGVIFSESTLAYLGIVDLQTSKLTSIGTLLSNGRSSLSTFPHVIFFPALFISLLMISFNLFGNGLRDAFNPSLRGAEE